MATKSYDYQSAFDIIGPVMMGPSSSHQVQLKLVTPLCSIRWYDQIN